MYIVARNYGPNTDYLKAFDADYGTACVGSPALALQFETHAEAESAARKANRLCYRRPADMTFTVVPAPALDREKDKQARRALMDMGLLRRAMDGTPVLIPYPTGNSLDLSAVEARLEAAVRALPWGSAPEWANYAHVSEWGLTWLENPAIREVHGEIVVDGRQEEAAMLNCPALGLVKRPDQ